MPYVQRTNGAVTGLFANAQPGYAEEWLEDDHADVVAFLNPTPTLEEERDAMVCSRFQARAALHAAGILAQIETAVAQADPFVQIAWADAVEFRRNSPTIAALQSAVGLTDAQIDNLFRSAVQIEA